MKDIMIDIETMGNTHEAAIIQLAACYFDRETKEIGEVFDRCISLDDCLDHGFVVNKETEDWWKKQNQDILNNILLNGEPVRAVLSDFSKFFKQDSIIWSHATFDFVIVQNYLTRFRLQNMHYKSARDIRTIVDLSGIDLDKYDWSKGKTHNAIDDCRFQVNYVVDAMCLLKTNVATG